MLPHTETAEGANPENRMVSWESTEMQACPDLCLKLLSSGPPFPPRGKPPSSELYVVCPLVVDDSQQTFTSLSFLSR